MILKSMSGRNSKQTLTYVLKDLKKLENDENKKLVIKKNVQGKKLDTWIKQFKAHEETRKCRRKDEVKMIHTVLSFHGNDGKYVTEKVLKTMTKEYMRLRGENMYIAVAHYNDNKHIHVCESGTRLDGKSNRLSKAAFEKLRVQLQEFQQEKFPELTNSLPNHDKTNKRVRDITLIQNLRNSNKATLLKLLEEAKTNASSKQEFYNTIKEAGHEVYSRNGKETGIVFNGATKFRFKTLDFDIKQIREIKNEELNAEKQLEEFEDIRCRSSDTNEKEASSRSQTLDEDDKEKEPDQIEDEEMDDDFER